MSAKTTYRKGACKNCGAITHKEKDCVERPRSSKKAAWKSGLDIAPDEVSFNLENHGKVSYDAKRDQWKGYNPEEYRDVIEKHNRIESERRKVRHEEKETKRRNLEGKKKKRGKEPEKKVSRASHPKKTSLSNPERGENPQNDLEKEETTNSDGISVKNSENSQNSENSENSENSDDSDSDSGSDDGDDEDNDAADFIERDESARDFQGTHAPQGKKIIYIYCLLIFHFYIPIFFSLCLSLTLLSFLSPI
jgi:pre-mRNA-processing factor SLU7